MHSLTTFALTDYQVDIWSAESRVPDGDPQFNVVLHERLTGEIDVPLLRSCLERALSRNDAFALRFDERDGEACQWLEPEVVVEVVDFSAESDPIAASDDWRERSLRRGFRLRRARLYEAAVLLEGPGVVSLFLKAHHLIVDAWAINHVSNQIWADYAGTPVETPPSYLDSSAASTGYRTSDRRRVATRYHQSALKGLTPALFKRGVSTTDSARHEFVVPGALVERVLAAKLSPFAVVTSAFAAYLSRLHGTPDVVLGVPFLNRHHELDLRTVGQFANNLPVRVDADPALTLPELARRIRRSTQDLREHERLPLGDVVRAVRGARQLFDTTVSYLRFPRSPQLPGVTRETRMLVPVHRQDALSVVIHALEDSDELIVVMDCALDVFDRDFPIENVARHVLSLIEKGIDQPDTPLAHLPLLDAAERAAVISVGQGPDVEFDRDATLPGLIERRTAACPDRVAVAWDHGSQTYAELDARAAQVAHHLRERGVRAEDRVAVMVPRGPELLPALLGVLKAGAAYVPIDPGYPAERIRYLLENSGAAVVLREADVAAISGAGAKTTASADNLAYVIYTSGSTGKPKGVMVEHRSVVNRLAWMQRRYPIGADNVLLQKTPVSFDVSVWELFWWAIEGARLALLPPGGERDPRTIVRAIEAHGVTVVHFVPSMLGPFLDLLEEEPGLRHRVASLRRVFCSGEALPPARVAQFGRVFQGPHLVNLYGPTEATVDVSYYDCDAGGRVPIGRPIDNTQLYVLDAVGAPQPPGVPGELWIGGVGVARGYLGNPELTEQRFVPDPFRGGRLYRTGDLARWLADGQLEYLGRLDDQVKIRGNRVELGEVRAAMADLPGVRDAVVVDHRSEARGTQLVGYYVADEEISPALLRSGLTEAVPEFMIPAQFVRIDRIPLTPSGKADRRALPAVPLVDTADHVAPRDEVESVLAAVWARVLGHASVGVHDDYFVLGGDSILMLRVRAEAEKRGLSFDLSDLMQHPTVAGLAAHVRTDAVDDGAAEPFALVSLVDRGRLVDAVDAYPLTRLQLGMIYHSRGRSAVYHDVFQYSLRLPWHETEFRAAFERLVARHPVLRSAFELGGCAEPLQVVRPIAESALEIVASDAGIREHVEERRWHDYEFTRAPLALFRVHVCADSIELVLSFHHAILDGGSVATLVSELLQDYLHLVGAELPPVARRELPSQAEYVLAERAALADPSTRAFWQDYLRGATPVRPRSFVPHSPPAPGELITRDVAVPDELTEAARALARDHSLPLKSVLFAVHCLTLGLFSGATDVTTGLITHGRPERADAEHMTGLFLNTVPTRLDLGAASRLDVVREAFAQEQRTHPWRRYPLSAIQEDFGGPVLDTAFNFIHFRQLADVFRVPGVELLGFRTWEETNFALLVNAMTDPVSGRIGLRLDFRGDVCTSAQADLYASTFVSLLRRLVDHPQETPSFAFLASSPQVVAAESVDVVRAVRAQIARTPDAIALTFGERQWTYAELGSAANRVAARLLELGATPGDRVGISMTRSPEAIAVLLGVLTAGAVAVPLDSSYPAERIAVMVQEAQPFRVITDGDEVLSGPDVEVPVPELGLAYVLFTSGSTGRPKGVAMGHRALANLVAWQNRIPSGAAAVTVQYAPSSFDVSFQEIFCTLTAGGRLVLVAEEQRRDMPALLRLLDAERVERLYLPYVALQQLAEASTALNLVPSALTTIISSGEQLRVTDEIRRFCAALPGVLLENQYGPTESHVVTSFTMTGDPAAFPALPPIGTAISGAAVHVLDDQLRPVPAGAQGELYLGGVCLADGYFGRPELTAERFVSTEFGRLYRTGDLGFALPGGSIVCAGRVDGQVKIRGFRVEPAEVELALTRFADVREVAVVARTPDGDSCLAAFLVGSEIDLEQLGRQLREVLPEYLVPSRFAWLPALPLTPSGKRDDAALREIPLEATGERDTTEPADAYERTLAEMVAGLLQQPIGVRENIFDAGGTSLTAMRLVVQIEQRYGVTVPLSELIAAPTVTDLAHRLRSGGAVAAFDPLVPIRVEGTRPPLFFVHPMGGNVLCYLRLAKHLPEDRPFYALQAAGCDPGTEPIRGVPELAATYLKAIRRVQPHGPYSLGGWSFGGFVAFEMARQLRSAGEEVAGLVLLDTTALNPGRRLEVGDDAMLGWFFWELLWLRLGGRTPLELIPDDCVTLDEKFAFIARFAADRGVLPAGSTGAIVRRLFDVYEANWRAAFDYRPEGVTQDLTLVHALEPLPEVLLSLHTAIDSMHRDPANGWRDWTSGEVTVVDVAGDHLTIVEEPHVKAVAEAIVAALGE